METPNFLERETYQKAFEEASIGMAIVDREMMFVDVNKAFCQMLGYSEPELLKKTVLDVTHPDDLQRNVEKLQKLFAGKTKGYTFEKRFLTKTGEVVWANVTASPLVKGKDGRPLLSFAVIENISTRKKLEDALKESESNYHTMIEMSPDAVAVHSEGKVVYVNNAGVKLLGAKKAEEIIGRPTLSFVHPDSLPIVTERIKMMAQTGKMVPLIEEKFIRLDGTPIDVEVVARPVFFEGKKAVQVVIHDITESKKIRDELRKSEERYRNLAEAAHDMIFVLDRSGVITYVNSFAAAQFNLKPEAMIGHKREEFFGPSAGAQEVSLRKVFEKGESIYRETRTPFRERTIWLGTWLVPLKKNGEVVGILGLSRDISAQKADELELMKLNHALKESEESYRGLFNSVGEAIYIQDTEGKFLDVNPGAEKMYGYSREWFIGKSPLDVSAPGKNDLEKIKKCVERAFAGEPQEFEFWGVRSTGEAFPKDVHLYKGKYFGKDVVIALAVDITERKKAEEKLASEREFLTNVVNSLPGIYYLFDKEGKFRLWNENLVKVGEYLVEEMLSRRPADFFPEEERPLILEKIKEVFEKGYAEIEATLLTKSGKRLPYFFNGARVQINGETMVSGMGVNIATRKEVERMRDEFMMIAAHELRAPMTAMKWLVSMILDGTYGPVSEELKKPLSGMTDSIDRLVDLVNDMINISRIEAGRLVLEPTEFDIKKLVDKVVEEFSAEAKKKGLSIDSEKVVSLNVFADVDRTTQIVSNLIDNAIKYTDEGKITLAVEKTDGLARLLVTDTGVGIPEDFKTKLFSKFVQVIKKDERRPKGTGLGLYISRELARNQGGDLVLLESEVGRGSSFALTLPIK